MDVSTASYTQNFSVAAQDAAPQGIAFNSDYSKMFVTGSSGTSGVHEYNVTDFIQL